MNLQKIARQLRREAKANPKKAAVLGLIGLVAIYFWAPLILQWCGSGATPTGAKSPTPPASSAASGVGVAVGVPAASTPSAKPTPETKRLTWSELVQAMEDDPHTRPTGPLAADCDPFHTHVEVAKADAPQPAEPEIAPEKLELVLSATILTANRRMARINGQTYAEGATIEVAAKDGKSIAFTLASVEAKQVGLQRNGKTYALRIAAPADRSGRSELLGSVP